MKFIVTVILKSIYDIMPCLKVLLGKNNHHKASPVVAHSEKE